MIFEIFPKYQKASLSPDVREFNTVLDSGFFAMDSGFQVPSGWIPVFEFDFKFQSLAVLRIADFKTRDSRFNKQNFPGFLHKQSGIPIQS